jgi:TonB-linked SusC/RagA family outer membrane protein
MKKNFYLWVYSNPALKKLITEFEIAFFIIVVSVSNVLAIPISSKVNAKLSETESQQITVSGTVTDASTREVMAGVNIQVKGTTIGAISDIDGKYLIPSAIDRNAVLVFSFIGFVTQEISVAGRVVIDVALSGELTGLEEVVVIGYGTAKKETLTGAVAAIQAADIISTKATSVAASIQGKIPGVQIRQTTAEPGTFASLISIRGFGTPLLVIDGVVRDGMSDFERLNPDDIASISVLKDAAAAIYGMNADNGVIIVTTKTGIKGKTKFSYSSMFSTKQPTTTDRQESITAYEHRVLKNEIDKNTMNSPTYSAEELEKWRLGSEQGYQDYNWYKICIRDWTNSQQHNFSAQGGSENVTFYTSLGYMNDNGLLVNNEIQRYDKYNFRTNVEATMAKGLTAKVSVSGKYDTQTRPPASYFWLFKRIIVADRGVGIYTLANPTHFSSVPAENVNPYAQMTKSVCGYVWDSNLQYQTTLDLNYQVPLIKGLTLGFLAAYDGNITDSRTLNKGYYLYDYRTDVPGTLPLSNFQNRLTNFYRYNIQSRISYRTSIANTHNISATLVHELRKLNTNYVQARRQYDDLYTRDVIGQGSLTNQSTAGNRTEEAFMSYIGRFNYDYKGKYLLEFSFREDGSYRYAPAKRWAFFPAVSVGWRMSEEPFIKNNLLFISNLKLRGSYGQMGADAGNPFQYYSGYTFGSVSGGYVFDDNVLTLGMVAPGVVNDNLTWINTKTTDIGIDINLLKGKLGFTADYFEKKREGLLATAITSVPNTFGATFPQENLNSDKVRGYELMISHRNKIRNFEYGVSANVTYSRRYLLYVEKAPYTNTYAIWKSSTEGNGRIQGREWIYRWDGVYTSVTDVEENAPLIGGTNGNFRMLPGMQKIVDVNGDGRISGDDQMPDTWAGVGSNPPLQYGMTMDASWKGFDVNMLLQGSSLFTVYNTNGDIWGYGRMPTTWSKYMDRWHPEDPNANPFDPATVWIPGEWEALTNSNTGITAGNTTDRWRLDATYLRIKSLEVGYTVPANITRKVRIDNVRLFVNVFNLYTFCQKSIRFLDPERNEGDYQADLTYPLLRSYNFGISINF